MLSISFSQVRAADSACARGFAGGNKLAAGLGVKEGQPVELTRILAELGINDTLWCLGSVKLSFKIKAESVAQRYIDDCIDVLNNTVITNSQAVRQSEYIIRRYTAAVPTWQKAVDISYAMPRAVSIGQVDAQEKYKNEIQRQHDTLMALLQEN